jgi:hypothetical protein
VEIIFNFGAQASREPCTKVKCSCWTPTLLICPKPELLLCLLYYAFNTSKFEVQIFDCHVRYTAFIFSLRFKTSGQTSFFLYNQYVCQLEMISKLDIKTSRLEVSRNISKLDGSMLVWKSRLEGNSCLLFEHLPAVL